MVLIIKPSHTKGTSYDNIHNDALLRAIKEQYPDLKVKTAYADFFVDQEGNQYSFNTTDYGYSRGSFRSLEQGTIKEIRLELTVERNRAAMHRLL